MAVTLGFVPHPNLRAVRAGAGSVLANLQPTLDALDASRQRVVPRILLDNLCIHVRKDRRLG
jgi:hypothetical protein